MVALARSIRFHATEYTISPLAVMGDSMFFDGFEIDSAFLEREEASKEARRHNEFAESIVLSLASIQNDEERINALLSAID